MAAGRSEDTEAMGCLRGCARGLVGQRWVPRLESLGYAIAGLRCEGFGHVGKRSLCARMSLCARVVLSAEALWWGWRSFFDRAEALSLR